MFIEGGKGNIAGFVSLAKGGKMKQCCKMTLGQLQLKYGTFFFFFNVRRLLAVKKQKKIKKEEHSGISVLVSLNKDRMHF